MYRTILDGRVVDLEPDVRKSVDQVCLQARDLIAICHKPGSPFQSDRVRGAIHADLVGPDLVWPITPLAEIDLPGAFSVPGREPLACHEKVPRVVRVENEYKRGQPLGC